VPLSFEFLYLLFFVCFLAELVGLQVLSLSASRECCHPANTTDPAHNGSSSGNFTVAPICFVDDLFYKQRGYLIGTVLLILLSYAVTSAILMRENSLKGHPACLQAMWKALRMLAHVSVLHTVNLCIIWLAGVAMGFSLSLARIPCITDGRAWNTYVQYLGLGIFTLLWGIATEVYMQDRVQKAVTANLEKPIHTRQSASQNKSRFTIGTMSQHLAEELSEEEETLVADDFSNLRSSTRDPSQQTPQNPNKLRIFTGD
jgi:hypothetical protein